MQVQALKLNLLPRIVRAERMGFYTNPYPQFTVCLLGLLN